MAKAHLLFIRYYDESGLSLTIHNPVIFAVPDGFAEEYQGSSVFGHNVYCCFQSHE